MAEQVIEEIANKIVDARRCLSPLRVGVDGIDAAGKTYLADRLADYLTQAGHPALRASIDGFHHPRRTRYQRGSLSPDGYYYDSFDYDLLKTCLLEPLEPGGSRICRLKAFDFQTDTGVIAGEIRAADDHILIFDGVFLFRREIERYWDLKIFVEINFQTSIQRALARDLHLFGDEAEILKRYQERYIPGQRMYLEIEKPGEKADIVIQNDDYTKPFVVVRGGA